MTDNHQPTSSPPGRGGSRLPRLPLLILCLAIVPLVGLAVLQWAQRASSAPNLEMLWRAPGFTLRDQQARPVGDADLRGSVVVVNFIFTRCTDICPVYLTPKMRELQRLLDERGIGPDRVRLVSFSVDPEFDTSKVLAEYAGRFGANDRRWSFLTGPRAAMEDVASGFRVTMDPATPGGHAHGAAAEPPIIAHSGRFFILDADWRVRALHSADEVQPATMLADAQALLRERNVVVR